MRTRRVSAQIKSARHAHHRDGAGHRPRRAPEIVADRGGGDGGAGLLEKSHQRRRRAGAIGKRRQRAGLGLRQRQAHAGEIDGHGADQPADMAQAERHRRRHDQAAGRHDHGADADGAVEPEPHDDARADIGAHHVAGGADRIGGAERDRRQSVNALHHERGARHPGEQADEGRGQDAEMGEKAAMRQHRAIERRPWRPAKTVPACAAAGSPASSAPRPAAETSANITKR